MSTGDERRFDLEAESRQPNALGFMIRSLLSSRVETGLSDEDGPGEDDVNIYLTHLMCAYVDPSHHRHVARWVAPYDSAVFERVRNSTSNRLKYTVYKANADHLLMCVGVFGCANSRQASLPEVLQTDDGVHVGRGKAYYDFASTYSRSVFGRHAAITDVLGKLALGFEKYVRLLSHLRSEYLNLIDPLSEGELYHLQRTTSTDLGDLQDQLLDAYSDWRQEPSALNRARVESLAARLQAIDPSFRFNWPEA